MLGRMWRVNLVTCRIQHFIVRCVHLSLLITHDFLNSGLDLRVGKKQRETYAITLVDSRNKKAQHDIDSQIKYKTRDKRMSLFLES